LGVKSVPFGCKLTAGNRSRGAVAQEGAAAKTASRYKDTIVLIVGSAHTGHGDLGVSLDDRLLSLGARTLSVDVAAQKAPSRRDWGTNHASADFRISDPMELASLLSGRYPGM